MTLPHSEAIDFASVAIIGLLMVGCGGPSSSYQGVVRFDDGTPVQSGSIEFRSLADGNRFASRIATDGSFALADQRGTLRCPAGKYEVVVVQIVLTEDLAAKDHDHGHTVPRRYADYYTSGLRVTNPETTENQEQSSPPLQITIDADTD